MFNTLNLKKKTKVLLLFLVNCNKTVKTTKQLKSLKIHTSLPYKFSIWEDLNTKAHTLFYLYCRKLKLKKVKHLNTYVFNVNTQPLFNLPVTSTNKAVNNYTKTVQFLKITLLNKYFKQVKNTKTSNQFTKWRRKQDLSVACMYFWEDYYNTLPLSSFFNKKISVINYNIASMFFDKSFSLLLQKALKFYPFLQLNRVVAKLLASVFSILVLKETKALTFFLQSIMQEVHYSKHMFFFNFAGQLIHDIFTPWIYKFGCLGVGVVFRGKLAVGGNSRKRALKYKTGMLSSSSKYIKINRTFSIVRTKTGAVGFSITVAW